MEIKRAWGTDNAIFQDAKMIRQVVFVTEQGIDAAVEFEMRDAVLQHIVGYTKDGPVTTARIDVKTPRQLRLQRVATLPYFRGQGFGSQLLKDVIRAIPEGAEVSLNAQKTALDFYRQLGFEVVGAAFLEVGITHFHMRLVKD